MMEDVLCTQPGEWVCEWAHCSVEMQAQNSKQLCKLSPEYDGRRAVHTNAVDGLISMLRCRRKAALRIAPQIVIEDV
jgi:hypothetical protein